MSIRVWILSAAAIAAVSACGMHDGTALYRDISGKGRGNNELEMALAQCRYEVRSTVYSAPEKKGYGWYQPQTSVGQGINNLGRALTDNSQTELFDDCMLAKGFRLVGYE